MMLWTGSTNIYILTALTYGRYRVVRNQIQGSIDSSDFRYPGLVILFCSVLALVWAVMPLIGWSNYSLQGFGTTCSVEWSTHTLNMITFNANLFLVVFFIPLLIIGLVNFKLIRLVSVFFGLIFSLINNLN